MLLNTVFIILLFFIAIFKRLFYNTGWANKTAVHTPQDVLVGFVISLACLWTVWKIGAYLQKHPEKENKILIITSLLCVLALIYTIYKSYPLDYNAKGKLLVNPQKMLKSSFESCGALFAFCVARYIEKTWIKFKATGLNFKGCMCGIIGLIPLALIITYCGKPFKHLFGYHWGHTAFMASIVFYIIAFYPLVIKLVCSKEK